MNKNYIFDLYGTLVDIKTNEEKESLWEGLADFYGSCGAVYFPAELKNVYLRLLGQEERSHGQNYDVRIEKIFQRMFENKNVHKDIEYALEAGRLFRRLSIEYIRLYDGVPALLSALKSRGGKIFLLSNAQSIFTVHELRQLGIYDFFDGIYISSDYGVKKPDIRFFNILIEKERLVPKECIMIGNDRNADIAGALSAGMGTFYIHSNLSPDVSPAVSADHEIYGADMEQVAEILQLA